ncbi:MAG: hypothetical protein WKF84_04765 [Pyrinomonadaceae bacterium]
MLINSRTEVNYMCAAPIYLAMKDDARVQLYFASTEDPANIDRIYREADPDIFENWPAARRPPSSLTHTLLRISCGRSRQRGTCRIQMLHGVAGKYNFDVPHSSALPIGSASSLSTGVALIIILRRVYLSRAGKAARLRFGML